ncbi:MAG TPA: VaFE repeat-containing surface-anchored protein [Candidatus Ozemobacteraceae bacterium]
MSTRLHVRFRLFWPAFLLIGLLCLCLVAPAAADIPALEAERAKAVKELEAVVNAINLSETMVRSAGEVMSGLETALGKYVAARDAQAGVVAGIRSRLREIDIQLGKLRSPNDLATAWSEYKNNRTEENFIKLYTTVRGVRPDNATRESYVQQESILQLEIRNKVIVPVLQVLVKLGGLIKQINELAFNGVGICHPRDADGALEAVDELLGTMQKHFSKLETKMGMKDDQLLVAGVAVELSKNFQDFFDPQELIPDKLKEWSNAFEESSYSNWIPGKAAAKLQAAAEQMAEESYEKFNEDTYGTKDRARDYEKFSRMREEFAKAADESEAVLKEFQKPVDEFSRKVAESREKYKRILGSYEDLLERKAELERRIPDLAAQIEDEKWRELSKPIPGEKLAEAAPVFAYLNTDRPAGFLAADDLTAMVLGFPREQRFALTTRVAQVVRSKAKSTISTGTGSRESIISVISRGDSGDVYKYPGIKMRDEQGRVEIDTTAMKLVGRAPGTAKLVFEVPGWGDITTDQAGNHILQTRTYTSRHEVPVARLAGIEVRNALGSVGRIDLVSTAESRGGMYGMKVDALVDYGAGTSRQPVEMSRLTFTLAGDSCAIVKKTSATEFAIDATDKPGVCTVEIGVAGSAGTARKVAKIRVTSSVLRAFRSLANGEKVAAGVARKAEELPIGASGNITVLMDGPAPAEDYVAELVCSRGSKVFEPGRDGITGTTRADFESSGMLSQALLSFTFGKECLNIDEAQKKGTWFNREPISVSAVVRRRSDKAIVTHFGFGEIIPVATVKRLRVVMRGGGGDGAVVDAMPLFRPADRQHNQWPFAIRIELESGDRITVPLNAVEQGRPEGLLFGIDGSSGTVLFNMGAMHRVGWETLTYRLSPGRAAQMHVTLSGDYEDASILFSVNRLELWKRGNGVRMTVLGPQKDAMDGYAVRWKAGSGMTTTSFRKDQGEWICDGPENMPVFEAVLLNPRGTECGVVRGTDGKAIATCEPDHRPTLTIETPAPLKAGAIASVRATCNDLPSDGPLSMGSAEYYTLWNTTGPYGKVKTSEGSVYPLGPTGFLSIGHVEYLRGVPEGGARIPVEVELYRRTDWQSFQPKGRLIASARGTLEALYNPSLPPFSGQIRIVQGSDGGSGVSTRWVEGAPEVSLERMVAIEGNNPFNVQNPIVNVTRNGQTLIATDAVPITSLPEPPVPGEPTVPAPPAPPEPPAPVPTLTTSARDKADGDKTLPATGGTIIDTVSYTNLTAGRSYTLKGVLMSRVTGQSTGIIAEKTFTAAAAGTVTQEFSVGADQADRTLVVFETLHIDGSVVARHEDLLDVAQSVAVGAPPPPLEMTTAARDKVDGDKTLPSAGGTIVDTVSYKNLTAGRSYTLKGTLVNKATGQTTGITAEKTFTAQAAAGTVTQEFPVTIQQAGRTLVVYEQLYDGATLSVKHENLNDAAQTITVGALVPSLATSAKDKADGDRTLPSTGGIIVDTVSYTDLVPGKTYTLKGEMMDKSTGLAVGITTQKTFTPSASAGTVTQEFTITAQQAGKTLVVYETVLDGATEVVKHTDLTDAAQAVAVEEAQQGITGLTSTVTLANVSPANPTIHMACILLDPNTSQGSLSAGDAQMFSANRVFDIHVTPTYNIGDGDPGVHFDRAQANSGSANWRLAAATGATNTLFYNTGQNISVFNVNTRVTLFVEQAVAGGSKIRLELTVTRNGNGTAAGDYQLVVHTAEYVN